MRIRTVWIASFLLAWGAFAQAPQPAARALLAPGKIDSIVRAGEREDTLNLMWWTPFVKGGLRVTEPAAGSSTRGFGVFVRPLLANGSKDDLIVGAHVVTAAGRTDWEAQAEYRLPSGIGFGGGVVRRETSAPDVSFVKLTYRNKLANSAWSYIAEAQAQRMGGHESLGGYAAVYDPRLMLVYGNDGEQWRGTLGIVARERKGSAFRPALEVWHVDNTIGRFAGTRFWSIAGTAGFTGGFLSHPARLGRAMGPQGLEFANPVSFLSATWNRRLDPWEFGGLVGVGLVRNEFPNGTHNQRAEVVVFPFQLAGRKDALASLFAGALQIDDGRKHNGWILGVVHPIRQYQVTVEVEDDTSSDPRVTAGLIRRF